MAFLLVLELTLSLQFNDVFKDTWMRAGHRNGIVRDHSPPGVKLSEPTVTSRLQIVTQRIKDT